MREDAELRENLEPIADAEEETAVGVVLLQGVAEEAFRLQLSEASAHHVVPVGEATGKDDQLRFFYMSRRGGGDGLHLRGKAGGAECALRLYVAVRSGVFKQECVRHGVQINSKG